MKSDLRLVLPVVIAVVVAAGCQQKKGATIDSSLDVDSAAAIEDTIPAVDEKDLILTKYRNIDFEDTLGFALYGAYEINDTVIAGNYIRYGTVISTNSSDSIYFKSKKGTDTIYEYHEAGRNTKIFINPVDKNDALIIDRDLIHEKLDVANNSQYFDSLKLEMVMAKLSMPEIHQDTILFTLIYGIIGSDVGYLSELKVLKEDGKYLLWVRDASDEIVWDEE